LTFQVGTRVAPVAESGIHTWVERAGKVNIGSFIITGGYFYFGTGLGCIAGYRSTEPALVNPKLPIDFAHIDWTGEGLNYWPSYDGLTPGERAAYVSWLASPRDSPSTPIGFVFLYFYGLERRALIDILPLQNATEQLALIVAEVKRLRSIYTESGSFTSYTRDFLDLLYFLMSPNDLPSGPPPEVPERARSFPPILKFGLGRYAQAGLPVPAYWAYEWSRAQPTTRNARTRTPDELKRLFTIRYQEKFGNGIVLKPVNKESTTSYRPASASFGGEFQFKQAVPDVTLITKQVQEIGAIANQCYDELSVYGRYIARHPEGKNTLAAAALLPAVMVNHDSSSEVGKFAQWVTDQLADLDEIVVDGADLVDQWPADNPDRLSKHEAAAMAELLGTFGVGFEPDVRFSGPVVGSGKAVLFKLGTTPSIPGAAWASASAVLQMTASIIATSPTNEALLDQVTNQLQIALQLDASQHNRLRAHLLWGTLAKMSAVTMKHTLAETNVAAKKHIGDFLIDVAATSGEIGPGQVTALTKAFKILDLEPSTIYSLLHERSTNGATEPIEVRASRPVTAGEAIPTEPSKSTGVTLNPDLIREKLADSARATALLGDIFADSDDDVHVDVPADSNATLSDALKKLAGELARQKNWSNDAFAALSKECGLLPSGAVESLNDHALDLCGEPLLEGGDTIEVNHSVLEEMLA